MIYIACKIPILQMKMNTKLLTSGVTVTVFSVILSRMQEELQFYLNSDYKIQQKIIDNNGNFIILNLDIQNQHLTLINLYGPNVDNPEFFKKISSYIDDIGNTDIIICGDYNCVINPELDYYNYKGINNAKARNEVLNLINEKFLIDAFRENCPTTKNSHGERKVPANKQD